MNEMIKPNSPHPSKQKIQLGEIQETLLIPLYGRATETQKKNGLLHDPAALEMVAAIDYNFSKFDGKPSLAGACLRTLAFDQSVQDFLNEHPQSTIVELGVGLNTRYERLDNELAHWFELDLPDTMELRSHFFEETSNRQFISASASDPAWAEQVKQQPGPYCFCSEAVLMYLPEAEVRKVLDLIAQNFPGSVLLFDSMSPFMQRNQKRHDVMKDMQARFDWAIPHPKQLESWNQNYKLLESLTFYDLTQRYATQVPAGVRWMYQLARWLFPPFVNAYRLNQLRLGSPNHTLSSQPAKSVKSPQERQV